jgi:hypothetical protein
MSSIGGTTPLGTTGARRRESPRALAWTAVLVVAMVGLVGAVAGAVATRASASASDRITGTVPLHTGGPLSPARSTTQPPVAVTPVAPGSDVGAGLDQSDPFLTVAGGRYILVTSGGMAADPINVPMVTSPDFTHWSIPVDALPDLPGWAEHGFTWAPDLHRFGMTYALYFTAMLKGVDPQTECIGAAFSPSPTGPFTAQSAPIICQLDQGGSIDPRVFVDNVGSPWVLWKSDQNIGGSSTPTKLWSQRLSLDGTRLLGSPSVLMSPDVHWQGTIIEAPDMVEVNGTYWVVYSGNWYNSPDYAIGAARCLGPAGPCADITDAPLLASNFQGLGPGEASVFHDAAGVWMLYSPIRSLAPKPDVPARPVFITRLGFGAHGPYLADGPSPTAVDLLAGPLWAPMP